MTLTRAIRVQSVSAGLDQVHLRLLATTDLHAHLLPFDYYTANRDPGIGLARLAELILSAQAEVPNTLLFDNGDTLQGTPLADTIVSEILPKGAPNPMISVMNALGYDAATLGNHDFDFGLDYLQSSLATARFPVVVSNADHVDGTPFLPKRLILSRTMLDGAGRAHDIRIGVTGALPPQVTAWSNPGLADTLTFTDILSAVSAEARALRADGADIVVVLAHSGVGVADAPPEAENVALQLAVEAGVDVVVAGHTHDLAAACVAENGVPIVQPAAYGTHLGLVDLVLTPEIDRVTGTTTWQLETAQVATPAVTVAPPETKTQLRRLLSPFPALRKEVAVAHRTTRNHVETPLGHTAVPLNTYFSTLAPCAVTQVVADAKRAAVAPLIAARPDLAGLPLLSAAAPFRAGGRGGVTHYTDIATGALKFRHAAHLYVYPNALCVLRMSGAALRDWLERSASIYNRITPGIDHPQPLINHAFAPYKFDRITGLRYRIDVSQPPRTDAEGLQSDPTASRIRDLCFASGQPLRDTDEALIVTNSYRAAGGGYILPKSGLDTVLTRNESVRDVIAQYISAASGPLDPAVEPSFEFAPLGGTEILFETGSGAHGHPERLAALGLQPAQPSLAANGFAAFRRTL
ncbi:bifunctional 2',3'-cyclic-nucleotide 2'-phosphodiesterase/3'-nucleotidase [Gymnodinialimonas ulvae]|uniref:bifunctional 2',3'-cyclic-nucleotide 2'-phosphodiesterase/3'-nucleotidase n=1 Tax=Gymnodinialimonas ulvae TaxID=3126504 RepID=UPI0030964653